MLEIHQFACLSDNYGYLVHDPASEETVCIDTPDAQAYLRVAAEKGWQITQIWNTHWHPDHAGGNAAIKAACQEMGGGCTVTAPAEVERIAPPDRVVKAGDTVRIGEIEAHVIDVGGHTSGHIAYHLPGEDVAFVGDAVFALGCGRMFEGTAEQFWTSLGRIKTLPPETMLYCGHEYTQANARFALHADPDNVELQLYAREIDDRRARHQPTVPMKLERELMTNPFFRADREDMRSRWGGSSPQETFAALRQAKDNF